MATSSFCLHMLQEYFKRVNKISEAYESQIIQFVNYEEVAGLLINRRILKQEEHETLLQLSSNEKQMSKMLEILMKRMWGLENLITVLIEVNIDSWLVEEMFQKYVQYVVNEVKKMQQLKACSCYDYDRKTFAGKAVFRFFQKCDGWLYSVGTSLGCLTTTIYPTRNSLQFLNDLLPIPRQIDTCMLPKIASIPFDFSYDSDHGVQITEVHTDAEKSPMSSKPVEESSKLNNGTLKKSAIGPYKTTLQRNGISLSPTTQKATPTRQPSEIKSKASLTKTSRGQSTVVTRDIKSSPSKKSEKEIEAPSRMTPNRDLNHNEILPLTLFQYSSENCDMPLIPFQKQPMDYQLIRPNSQSSEDMESLPDHFIFSPIAVANSSLDPINNAEALESGAGYPVDALPTHEKLYSPYPFHYSFGDNEIRFDTFSSTSSLSQTNGSSQELFSIVANNTDYLSSTSMQRSVSIPAFKSQYSDYPTSSNPPSSTERNHKVYIPSSTVHGSERSPERSVDSVPLPVVIESLQVTQLGNPNKVRPKVSVSVALNKVSKKSSPRVGSLTKPLTSSKNISKPTAFTTMSTTSVTNGSATTKKLGQNVTDKLNAKTNSKHSATPLDGSHGKDGEKEIPTVSSSIGDTNNHEIEYIKMGDVKEHSNVEAIKMFTQAVGQLEGFMKPIKSETEKLPMGDTSSEGLPVSDLKLYVRKDTYDITANLEEVVKTPLQEDIFKQSDSCEVTFFNASNEDVSSILDAISLKEKVNRGHSVDQHSNSNLVLRGVLEDDPMLENHEIFSEDSVVLSDACTGRKDQLLPPQNVKNEQLLEANSPPTPLAQEHVVSSIIARSVTIPEEHVLVDKCSGDISGQNSSIVNTINISRLSHASSPVNKTSENSSVRKPTPNVSGNTVTVPKVRPGVSAFDTKTNDKVILTQRHAIKTASNSKTPVVSRSKSANKMPSSAENIPSFGSKQAISNSSAKRQSCPDNPQAKLLTKAKSLPKSPQATPTSVSQAIKTKPKLRSAAMTNSEKQKTPHDAASLLLGGNNLEGLTPLSPPDSIRKLIPAMNEPFKISSLLGDKIRSISDLIGSENLFVVMQSSTFLRRTFSDTAISVSSNKYTSNAQSNTMGSFLANLKLTERSSSCANLSKDISDVNFHPMNLKQSGPAVESKSFAEASSQTTLKLKTTASLKGTSSTVQPVTSSNTPTKVTTSSKKVPVVTSPVAGKALTRGRHTPTGSDSSGSDTAMSSRRTPTPVTPSKPAWSNKKPTPTPLVIPQRFTPFSVEDYNFQQWANEWVSRQEKKKAEAQQCKS